VSELQPSLSVRLGRYRELAQQARREAARSQGAVQQSYLILAANWEELARYVQGCGAKKENASEQYSDRH
jgi:hypothetical protein